jgi:hypothetical protein
MRESETGIVEVVCKPPSLFRSIIAWMYSSRLEYEPRDLVSLVQVGHEYGIVQLERFAISELAAVVTSENIVTFLDRCFEDELPDAVTALEPFLVKFLGDIDARKLGQSCDVPTFVRVLSQTSLGNKERVELITKFVEADTGYELTAEDRMRLTQCLNRTEPLKPFLTPDLKWLRKGFYQQLKN